MLGSGIPAARYVGERVRRSEDLRLLTGRGHYVDDVKRPKMLHAAFVRSPVPHARVARVDVDAARALPGVAAVYTGWDIEAMIVSGPDPMYARMAGTSAFPEFTILATDKVRLVGDLVALVVAENRYVAEDACELVDVDYVALPSVPNAAVALDDTSEPLFANIGSNVVAARKRREFGDVTGVFDSASRVFEFGLSQHRQQSVPMECRGCVADYDEESETLTLYASTQSVGVSQRVMAKRLGLEPGKVRVLAGDIGGSFGLKISAAREEVAVAAASRALGRPVKWTEDRGENLAASGQAREEQFVVRLAANDDGQLLGLDVDMVVDTGSYPAVGASIAGLVAEMLPGPYTLSALGFVSTAVSTNKAPYVAYRGPWAAETFVRERSVDLLARQLGVEPLELRLRNVAQHGDPSPTMVTGRSLVGITAKESLERIAAEVDVVEFRRVQQQERERGRHLGLGVATFIEPAPGPRSATDGGGLGQEQIRVRLDADGVVRVFTGQMPHGQSHQTTLAQVAADALGVRFDQIEVVVGDTEQVPYGVTGGSRSATMAGGAALHGARQLKAKVLDAAANLLEANAADLDIIDGDVVVRGESASVLALPDIAVEGELEVGLSYDGGQGGWSGGTHLAIVDVDIETGLVRVVRYVVAEDCGVLINPAIVDGQIRGGVVQGIGAVLLERSAYDADANFQAATFMDYLLPTASDVPSIEIHHLETVPLDDDVNFRGVGEGGMIVAPATVVNAVEDALAPFGVTILEQHLPPWRVIELIAQATH